MTRTHVNRLMARSWRCRYSQQIGGGVDHDNNPVEAPLDPLEVLRDQARVAAVESERETEALRAVMSDDQVLDQFGVDLRELDD